MVSFKRAESAVLPFLTLTFGSVYHLPELGTYIHPAWAEGGITLYLHSKYQCSFVCLLRVFFFFLEKKERERKERQRENLSSAISLPK